MHVRQVEVVQIERAKDYEDIDTREGKAEETREET